MLTAAAAVDIQLHHGVALPQEVNDCYGNGSPEEQEERKTVGENKNKSIPQRLLEWLQDPLRMPTFADTQVPCLKWHNFCMDSMDIFSYTLNHLRLYLMLNIMCMVYN